MPAVQQSNPIASGKRASGAQRIGAAIIFAAIMMLFLFLYAASRQWLDPARFFGACGFQQAYQLPCPGCYITRAGMAFVRGDIVGAFYIQPAGAFFCCVLVVIGVFSLLIALFGIGFWFLGSPISGRTVLIIAGAVVVIFACGWAVTLARALAERNSF